MFWGLVDLLASLGSKRVKKGSPKWLQNGVKIETPFLDPICKKIGGRGGPTRESKAFQISEISSQNLN